MPRPISGNAVSPAERKRRQRERERQAEAEAQRQADARRQAEREAQQATVDAVKQTAHVMLDCFATPLCKRDEAERDAWRRLLDHIDRWSGR